MGFNPKFTVIIGLKPSHLPFQSSSILRNRLKRRSNLPLIRYTLN